MIMCNVKGVACSDESTKNYYLAMQLLLAVWSFFACFSSLFWFYQPHLQQQLDTCFQQQQKKI